MHLELLLEEPSAEAFFKVALPKMLPDGTSWNPVVFQGKNDLLRNLESRLKAYRRWLPPDSKIAVLIDEDRQDCGMLKQRMESAARNAGWTTKTASSTSSFSVLNRIAIEELEAWFFGDIPALVEAFPGVPNSLGTKSPYRNPDAIAGGTWESLLRVLQRAGHYANGLPKIEVARIMATHMDVARNTSGSFHAFRGGLEALLNSAQGDHS